MEKSHNSKIVVEVPNATTVKVPGSDHVYGFDRVFRWDAPQKEVYDYAAKPIVNDVLKGFNGTVFAYGQTGSGKTYTMEGPDMEDKTSQGVIPRMVFSVFQGISNAHEGIEFQVKVSIVEIYNERIKDLLDIKKDNLQIREDAGHVYIENITEISVGNEEDVYEILKYGHTHRSTGSTNMNEHSSRSHLVFVMKVTQTYMDESKMVGKLHLVDLAGSEKVGKTGSSGDRLTEAQNINKSLSALGLVIHALTDKSYTHIPYRDSKLTRILQESLGGNSKTSLIITCSPSSFNEVETISTLRFGERAKNIKNNAKVNHDLSPQQLKSLLIQAQARINVLEQLLKTSGIPIPPGGISATPGAQVALTQGAAPAAGGVDPERDAAKRDELIQNAERISELSRERGEMQQQLKSHDDDMQRLQDRLSDALDESKKIDNERQDKADEVERLKIEMSALQKENEEVSKSNKNLAAMSSAETSSTQGDGGESTTSAQLKDADKPLKRKVAQLDKNLESLTVMYHKLTTQNTSLKVQVNENEKKIGRRDSRVGQLEGNLREAKTKYEKLLTQCSNLTAAMDVMGRKATGKSDGGAVRSHSNIVKSVRGGFAAYQKSSADDSAA